MKTMLKVKNLSLIHILTAGDIICPTGVEVLNKDLEIAHLEEGATLEMELKARNGRGYISADVAAAIAGLKLHFQRGAFFQVRDFQIFVQYFHTRRTDNITRGQDVYKRQIFNFEHRLHCLPPYMRFYGTFPARYGNPALTRRYSTFLIASAYPECNLPPSTSASAAAAGDPHWV